MSTIGRSAMPERHVFLDAAAAVGVGTALDVTRYRHIMVDIATDGGGDADLTVLCRGTLQTTEPAWDGAQALDNLHENIALDDMQDATIIAGDTGFVVAAADDFRLFMVNVEGLEFVNFVVTARAQGEVTVTGKAFSNL